MSRLVVWSSILLLVTTATTPVAVAAAPSSSTFQIQVPPELKREPHGYNHVPALFGRPVRNVSMNVPLFYLQGDPLCTPVTAETVRAMTQQNHEPQPRNHQGTATPVVQLFPRDIALASPFMLMIDRGDCSFVTKVRQAQQLGAAAVVIADNTCRCSASSSCVSNSFCESVGPVLMDDGSGGDISIPSVLLYKEDADAIKAVLQRNKNQWVQVEWSHSLQTENNKDDAILIDYEYWSLPGHVNSRNFWTSFGPLARALEPWTRFHARFAIWDGMGAGCYQPATSTNGGGGGESEEEGGRCPNLCTNRGRYCANSYTLPAAVPPNEDDDDDTTTHSTNTTTPPSEITGTAIVTEALRRLCIQRQFAHQEAESPEEAQGVNGQQAWWTYVHTFEHECTSSMERFTSPACIQHAMQTARIDSSWIEDCMRDVGGVDQDTMNTLLDEEIRQQRIKGVYQHPMAAIQDLKVDTTTGSSSLSAASLWKALCAEVSTTLEPPPLCAQCGQWDSISSILDCIERNGTAPTTPTCTCPEVPLAANVSLVNNNTTSSVLCNETDASTTAAPAGSKHDVVTPPETWPSSSTTKHETIDHVMVPVGPTTTNHHTLWFLMLLVLCLMVGLVLGAVVVRYCGFANPDEMRLGRQAVPTNDDDDDGDESIKAKGKALFGIA